jgi:hypothetical protein
MTLISHRHRFIFIKTAKTASTSVQMALAEICGPEDICAPLTKKKAPREGEESYVARNHQGYFVPKFYRGEGLRTRPVSEIKQFFRRQKFRSHMPARDIRWRLGRRLWDSYIKVTVERNPWDKVVSDYYWARRHPENQIPFEQWVREGRWSGSHFNYYTIGGKVVADEVLRYESLADDLARFFERLGIADPPVLPHAKGGFRKKEDYRSVHTAYTRRRVEEEFHREIAEFHYSFD